MDLKYLVSDTDRHGTVRVYVRRYGRKVRIRELGTVEEFMAAYRAALEIGNSGRPDKPTAVDPDSLRWLVTTYFGCPEFLDLHARTRAKRRGVLDSICREHGTKPFARMETKHVRLQIRDPKAATPEAANGRVKALRQVFRWAVEVGYASTNPARDVPMLRPNNPDGFHTWTREEVQQFEARHPSGTKARLALALFLYTGVRISDVVRLGPQMERDGGLCFIEAKNRANKPKHREVPILPALRNELDANPSGHLSYLVTEWGRPYASPNAFGLWFKRQCVAAGLPHCTAHGLRKAGATIAAENRATEHQLMAIYGWDSPKQAALYTKAANRKR
ncbi:MAG: tyrosine-type recombinase/integrase, partial [Planctomycetota bacterium]